MTHYTLGHALLWALLACALPQGAAASITLGNTAVGSALDSGDSNFLNGTRIITGSSGVSVVSASVHVGAVEAAPRNQFQCGIYADNNGVPGALVAVSAGGTLAPNAWNTVALSASLNANGIYWLVYNTNGLTVSGNNLYYNATPGPGVFTNASVAFGTWPTSFGGATLVQALFSIYLTGEPTGAGTPTAAITAPAPGQTVLGTTTIVATASIAAGVSGVQFRIDGSNLGTEDLTSPYSFAWNTTTASNGSHSLTATARGSDGTLVTSPPVSVNVQNGGVPSDVGAWGPLLTWPLVAIHSTLLYTGKVLLFDEEYQTTHPKVWDPASGVFIDTPPTAFELWCCGQIPLANGNILTVGGHLADSNQGGIKATHQYNPATNTWTRTADMSFARWYPAVTRLGDGRVAIVSGQITLGVFADRVEIYEPSGGTLTTLPNVDTVELHEEEYPADFFLPSGQVLAISPEFGPVQLLDVGSASWNRVGITPIPLGTAVQYRPGKIMMSGGAPNFSAASSTVTAVLDMNTPAPAWRNVAAMGSGRYMHSLVMLPTGDVLALGGSSIAYQQATTGPLLAERWNPATETWSPLAGMDMPRMYHSTALLLPDGRVLSAGGGHNGAAPDMMSAQIYSPPYLFKGARPTVNSAPSVIAYASAFAVDSPNASDIVSVALMGLGAATHSTDVAQSYRELAFTKTSTQLSVSAPADSRAATPGHYMLFLVNSSGVPSVARIIRLGGTVSGDTTPPNVVAFTPPNGATGIAASTTATASFNEPIDAATITTATFVLRDASDVNVPSTVAYNASTFVATLTPSANLNASTTYRAIVMGSAGGVKDVAGNPLAANVNWSFTTAAGSGSGTVGVTTIGPLADSGCSGYLNGSLVTTSSGGLIKSISVYVGAVDLQSANRSFQLALYTNSSGKPGALIAATPVGTLTANAWNTLSVSATLAANSSYWLVFATNGRSDAVNNLYYSSGASGAGVFSATKVTFGSMPGAFPAPVTTNAVYSIHAVFGP